MKSLGAIFTLIGALSFWPGTAVAKPTELSCNTTYCDLTGEVGPSQEREFHGHCDGAPNTKITKSNSSMTCNDNADVKCSPADFSGGKDPYWECGCFNWSDKSDGHPTFVLTCPAPK